MGASVAVVDPVVELSAVVGARLVVDAVVGMVESEVVVFESEVVVDEAVAAVVGVVRIVAGTLVVVVSPNSGAACSEETTIVDDSVSRSERPATMAKTAITPTASGRPIPPRRTRSTTDSCAGDGGLWFGSGSVGECGGGGGGDHGIRSGNP